METPFLKKEEGFFLTFRERGYEVGVLILLKLNLRTGKINFGSLYIQTNRSILRETYE